MQIISNLPSIQRFFFACLLVSITFIGTLPTRLHAETTPTRSAIEKLLQNPERGQKCDYYLEDDIQDVEVDMLLSPHEKPEVIIKRLIDRGLVRRLNTEDRFILQQVPINSSGRQTSEGWNVAEAILGSEPKSRSGQKRPVWLSVTGPNETALFFTTDYYANQRRPIFRVTSPLLAAKMSQYLHQAQKTKITKDEIVTESSYYWRLTEFEREIEEEESAIRIALKRDYYIQVENLTNPKIFQQDSLKNTVLKDLAFWLGFQSNPLNEQPGFKFSRPRAKRLNEKTKSMGQYFAHLNFTDLNLPSYENNTPQWMTAYNDERPLKILETFARGQIPCTYEDWLPQMFHTDIFGIYVVPKKNVIWIQEASRKILERFEQAQTDQDKEDAMFLARVFNEDVVTLVRAYTHFLFQSKGEINFTKAVTHLYGTIYLLNVMTKMTAVEYAQSSPALYYKNTRTLIDRLNKDRKGSLLTSEERTVVATALNLAVQRRDYLAGLLVLLNRR